MGAVSCRTATFVVGLASVLALAAGAGAKAGGTAPEAKAPQATDEVLDFALFTIHTPETVAGFGYLELDPRKPAAGEEVYIPQHPGGRTKAIAMVNDVDGGCPNSGVRIDLIYRQIAALL